MREIHNAWTSCTRQDYELPLHLLLSLFLRRQHWSWYYADVVVCVSSFITFISMYVFISIEGVLDREQHDIVRRTVTVTVTWLVWIYCGIVDAMSYKLHKLLSYLEELFDRWFAYLVWINRAPNCIASYTHVHTCTAWCKGVCWCCPLCPLATALI